MRMALEGVKVLDLASMWAAPLCGMYLADQGADVIKVEPPEGDEARRLFTHPSLGNESPSFLAVNRNKRGIVVDLRKPEGLDIVKRLAKRSDVLIHNFRERAVQRMGLSYESLSKDNPGLVYVPLTAFGRKGPYASRPGYDLLVQAMSGIMHRRVQGTPIGAGIWATDAATPIALAYGVALALLERSRTGRGQVVETSLLNIGLALQVMDLVQPAALGKSERASSNQAVFAPYRCADDKWLLIVALSNKEWGRVCRALDLPHLSQDLNYATPQLRADHSLELFDILETTFLTKTREEWLAILTREDAPCVPILDRSDIYTHPQTLANGMIEEVKHATAGRTTMTGVPLRLSANPPRKPGPSPLQGEHTVEVLRELGYDAAAIAALEQRGVVK
ncbi:MAG: CoA transferase [Chloroflexi bacterium]|nr:CoA transferase [Chloroflexota bacterium]